METKELKIQIPNGYCIDESKSTFEKIVFKKKDTKPRSWEEYCHTRLDSKETRFGFAIGGDCGIYPADWDDSLNCSTWRNVLPLKELAEAFIAMMQLMSLRQDWIHKWSIDNGRAYDWKPIWSGEMANYCISIIKNKYIVGTYYDFHQVLSFPTEEIAIDFMNTFKDLLKIAKPLL